MRKLQINKEHQALIESVIRENPKFKGHENLIDLFCDAIYKKSYLLIDAIRDMSRLRRHLKMISDSSIEQVIKNQKNNNSSLRNINSGKRNLESQIVSLKSKNIKTNPKPKKAIDTELNQTGIVNLKEEIQRSEKYDSVDELIDPLELCPQKRVSRIAIEKLCKIVYAIDKKYPQKKYYEIFSLRYIKKYNQTEIARALNISQIELSKRFVELISLTKNNA